MRVSGYTVGALVRLYKALGDETRLRIVHLLAHRGELCVCDVEAILQVSQSKASRHLNHLKNAGVVEDRRDGTWVYYRLGRDTLPVLRAAIRELKKALADDDQAKQDLARAEASHRSPTCAPIEVARGGGG
ncbi:MAG: ArsR/SmtB family transcription factor [Myxococcota bacterium]